MLDYVHRYFAMLRCSTVCWKRIKCTWGVFTFFFTFVAIDQHYVSVLVIHPTKITSSNSVSMIRCVVYSLTWPRNSPATLLHFLSFTRGYKFRTRARRSRSDSAYGGACVYLLASQSPLWGWWSGGVISLT